MGSAAILELAERFEHVSVKDLISSPTNPRKHFPADQIAQLAATIREQGLLQPIVVREREGKGAKYEIVMGERRWRAAVVAEFMKVPVLIRRYSDEQVLDIQLIENIHRSDLTPLEQAVGYRALIDSNPDKHNVVEIATRIGMSVTWVWDTLSLNSLVPDAKKLLDDERITRAHAVLLARQKPDDQKRIIAPPDEDGFNSDRGHALWRFEHAGDLGFEGEAPTRASKADKYDGLKPVSVRELAHWITDHIRLDVDHAAKAQPLQYEETKVLVDMAAARPEPGKRPVSITHEYRVADDARDDDGERTYGTQSWVRADGKEKSKTCDYSRLGVVVAGHGKGDTLQVCVNRDRCTVHFGKVIKERAKNAKLRESGQGKKAKKNEEQAEARRRRENEKAAERGARWSEVGGRIETAIGRQLKALKVVTPALLTLALEEHNLPKATKPANLAKMLLETALDNVSFEWAHSEKDVRAWAKAFGIDVAAIEKAVDAELEEKATPKKKTA